MPTRLDLAGQRFGRLVALEATSQDKRKSWMWLCRCDCGASVSVRGSTLAAGRTSACASCATSAGNTTHGKTGSPLYQRWRAMTSRCDYRGTAWQNYGGRGISVCPRWRSFEAFERDMGPTFDPNLELDRIDVNGDYGPANCRWITRGQQQRNKRSNHWVTWEGRTLPVQSWAEALGIKPNTLLYRLRRGWSVYRAMTTGVATDVLLEICAPSAPSADECPTPEGAN